MTNALVVTLLLVALQAGPEAEEERDLAAHVERLFTLGKFEEAVQQIAAAYERDGDPAKLFAIAQIYRTQLNDCGKAKFFYERYRSECEGDCQRDPRTDELIESMRKLCAEQRDAAEAPPPGLKPEGPRAAPSVERTAPVARVDAASSSTSSVSAWFARIAGGGAHLRFGELGAGGPRIGLVVGRELGEGALRFAAAVGAEVMPLGYEHSSKGTLLFTELAVRGGIVFAFAERARLRGEVSVGVLVVSGQSAGTPLRSDLGADTSALLGLGATIGMDVHLAGPIGITGSVGVRGTPAGALDAGLLLVTAQGGAVVRW